MPWTECQVNVWSCVLLASFSGLPTIQFLIACSPPSLAVHHLEASLRPYVVVSAPSAGVSNVHEAKNVPLLVQNEKRVQNVFFWRGKTWEWEDETWSWSRATNPPPPPCECFSIACVYTGDDVHALDTVWDQDETKCYFKTDVLATNAGQRRAGYEV